MAEARGVLINVTGGPDLSRRSFLATTGSTLAGAVACGLVSQATAGTSQPQRGGTLRFATRGDAAGLDPHRNTIYLVSTLLAATTQGLIDLDGQSQPVPGVATAWDVTPDLLADRKFSATRQCWSKGNEEKIPS